VGLELELSRMSEAEANEFRGELGVESYDRDGLVRRLMNLSGQMLFFTAGEKEVRTWMIPQGATAVEAADTIHSDMARGFIRAEIMTCDDLIRLGGEREGLSKRVRSRCDAVVRIPGEDTIQSLNVPVAAGVILGELYRRLHAS